MSTKQLSVIYTENPPQYYDLDGENFIKSHMKISSSELMNHLKTELLSDLQELGIDTSGLNEPLRVEAACLNGLLVNGNTTIQDVRNLIGETAEMVFTTSFATKQPVCDTVNGLKQKIKNVQDLNATIKARHKDVTNKVSELSKALEDERLRKNQHKKSHYNVQEQIRVLQSQVAALNEQQTQSAIQQRELKKSNEKLAESNEKLAESNQQLAVLMGLIREQNQALHDNLIFGELLTRIRRVAISDFGRKLEIPPTVNIFLRPENEQQTQARAEVLASLGLELSHVRATQDFLSVVRNPIPHPTLQSQAQYWNDLCDRLAARYRAYTNLFDWIKTTILSNWEHWYNRIENEERMN